MPLNHLLKSVESAVNIYFLCAILLSVVLIKKYKTYQLVFVPFSSLFSYFVQVSQPRPNETTVFDGTAIFSRWNDAQYHETQIAVTIHRMEVFRMEFTYDSRRFVVLYAFDQFLL
jgi:hypothetical protein